MNEEIVVDMSELSHPISLRELCGDDVVGRRVTYDMEDGDLIITVFAD